MGSEQDPVTKGKEGFRHDHVRDHLEGTDDAAQTGSGGARGGSRGSCALRHSRQRGPDSAHAAHRRLFGALKHDGWPVTLEDMERAIAEEAREE